MDINNILNHADRHVVSQQSVPTHHLQSNTAVVAPSATYSFIPPPQFHGMAPPQPQPPPPPPPPPLPNTQIPQGRHVYYSSTAVYHLPPAVEVRHIPGGLQYRYTPLPTYEEPTSVEYVYQQYTEIPRLHSSRSSQTIQHCTQPSVLDSSACMTVPNQLVMSQLPPPPPPPPLPPQLPVSVPTSAQTFSRPEDHDPLISRFVEIDGRYHYRSKPIPRSDPPKRARPAYRVEDTPSAVYAEQGSNPVTCAYDFSTNRIKQEEEETSYLNTNFSTAPNAVAADEKHTQVTKSRKGAKTNTNCVTDDRLKGHAELERANTKKCEIVSNSLDNTSPKQSIADDNTTGNPNTETAQAALILENQSYGTEVHSDAEQEYNSTPNSSAKMRHDKRERGSKSSTIAFTKPKAKRSVINAKKHHHVSTTDNPRTQTTIPNTHKSKLKRSSRKKARSPTSIGDGTTNQESFDALSPAIINEERNSSSSSEMNGILQRNDNSKHNDHDSATTHLVPITKKRKVVNKERKRDPKKNRNPIFDPKEPYPEITTSFSGIPPNAIGDMLQVWEFILQFSKTLKLSSFKLWHLEQAIVHSERSALLDACVLRLIHSILSDEGLISELGIPELTVKTLTKKGNKNDVDKVFTALPFILSFESDEIDDNFLHTTVQKLANSPNKFAFYHGIGPAGRLRILRELVDYATMTDSLRDCVTDSMEHAEEEKKKMKEENAAMKKKFEAELRELRSELHTIKEKIGSKDSANDDSKVEDDDTNDLSSEEDRGKEEKTSRQEKLKAKLREKKEQQERRAKEREADVISGKIERIRSSLKTLKNIRQRVRGKDGEHCEIDTNSNAQRLQDIPEDPVRTHPLGVDRVERCYWFFEGSGRIWIENTREHTWTTISSTKDIQMLLKWLSPNREKERNLKQNIRSRLEYIEAEMTLEAKEVEKAKEETKEACHVELGPRLTRSEKRKASTEGYRKPKKTRTITTFLDYQNTER